MRPGARLTALLLLLLATGCITNNAAAPGTSSGPAASAPAAAAAPSASFAAAQSGDQAGAGAHVLGTRTRTSGCTVNGPLPDPGCTPGVAIPGVTRAQVCTSGYAKSVRDVPESEKQQVYREYGIQSHTTGEYEVDHLVSLEIGGSNDIANLWPEAAEPSPGFHDKDGYENYLHDQVCSGAMTLAEAQYRIASDWLRYWTEAGKPSVR